LAGETVAKILGRERRIFSVLCHEGFSSVNGAVITYGDISAPRLVLEKMSNFVDNEDITELGIVYYL
jgi:hypothetical protein